MACPPQEFYQPNPLSTYLDVDSLLSIIRSQTQHIQLLENKLRGDEQNSKIIEVPVEINEEKVIMLRDLLSSIHSKEIDPKSEEEWKESFHDALKIISNQKATFEFIKSALIKH
jgi:hypothetical protein